MKRNSIMEEINETIKYFGNPGKKDREKWVIEKWASANNIAVKSLNIDIERPDAILNGELLIEVVEVLPPKRKRGDELKKWRKRVKLGENEDLVIGFHDYSRLEYIKPNVVNIISDIFLKKFILYHDMPESKNWYLILYLNLPWTTKFNWNLITLNLDKVIGDKKSHFKAVYLIWEDMNEVKSILI